MLRSLRCPWITGTPLNLAETAKNSDSPHILLPFPGLVESNKPASTPSGFCSRFVHAMCESPPRGGNRVEEEFISIICNFSDAKLFQLLNAVIPEPIEQGAPSPATPPADQGSVSGKS
jgi:hypothetical protein